MTRPAHEGMPCGCDEEAADWCLRLAEGQLSSQDQERFDAWIADPKRRAAFEEAIAIWQGVESLGAQPELIPIRTTALEGYRRAHARRWAPARVARWRAVAAVAATLAVVLLLGVMFRTPVQVYETGIAERRIAILEDGSRLSMDAATKVEVRMSRDRRELRLVQGRAKFDVVGRPLRPFSVVAGDKIVVAVGTSFSVELVRSQMHVVLYEGHVRILEKAAAKRSLLSDADPAPEQAAPTAEWALEPGREFVASIKAPVTREAAADMNSSLTWESGRLSFIDEPLSLAAERLNRYSKRKVVIADAATGQLKINGVFRAGDTEAFAEGAQALLPVQIERAPDRILIRRR
jgi:transmembrane sensor